MQKYFQTVWYTVFAALSCALFFSCTDVDHGLFWNIEHEEKIPDNSLPNDIGVYGMIKVPKHTTWNYARYYLAGGALFFRDAAPGDWKKISTPGSGGIVNDVAVIKAGTSIAVYVSVMYGNSGRLYRLDEQVNPNYTVPNPSYDPLLPPGPSNLPRETDSTSTYTKYNYTPVWEGRQIQRLISIDTDADGTPDEFFISAGTPTYNPYQFFRCSWNGTEIDIQDTGFTGEIITGGTYDGSHYWFTSRSHVFRVDSSALPLYPIPPSFPVLPDSETWRSSIVWDITSSSATGSNPDIFKSPGQRLSWFEDVFYDGSAPVLSGIVSPNSNYSTYNSSPNLYIACGDGLFMTTTQSSGTPQTWDRIGGGHYTSIAKIPNTAKTIEPHLIAGRTDSGLLEFFQPELYGEPSVRYPRGKYSEYSGLYNANVTRLLVDDSLFVIVAGTTRSGAWKGDYSHMESPDWSQE